MTVAKLSLSFDADLADQLREEARRAGRSVSSLAAELTADGLRHRALREAIQQYEAEHGVITEQEMKQARTVAKTRHYGPSS